MKVGELRMMKTAIGAAALLAAAACPALGADFPRYSGPGYYTPPPGFSWVGPYFGLNLGYQFGAVSHLGIDPSGFVGGGQAGYNWQFGRFVFGAETDIQLSGAEDTFAAYKFANPWFGTLRGRGGIALDNVLLYGTAGLAYGGGRLDFAGLRESQTHVGWTAGLGIEVAFTPHWSAKAEYLYVDLGKEDYVLTGLSEGIHSNVLRFGVNYRF